LRPQNRSDGIQYFVARCAIPQFKQAQAEVRHALSSELPLFVLDGSSKDYPRSNRPLIGEHSAIQRSCASENLIGDLSDLTIVASDERSGELILSFGWLARVEFGRASSRSQDQCQEDEGLSW